MTGQLPRPLRAGDRVQLAAASSALDNLERLEAGSAVLQSWGLQVERHPEPLRRWGYLAGADPQRHGDLLPPAPLTAFIRGGWGAARLLEAHQSLSLPDGWLLGFSDVTSLLWAQRAQGGCGGIHGPLVTTLATEPAWSQERLRQLLFGEPLAELTGAAWSAGVAIGPLLVGNLTVATHLLGTPHLPDLRGAVLVLEDVGEAPYRIDRMLTHWRLSGALQQLAGIGFLNALINVAILSALILNLVGQQFDGQKALGACGGLGRLFDLVVERLWQAYVDGSGGHGRNAPVKM
jgi:muramoyltetrapeptide carboxypeptidase